MYSKRIVHLFLVLVAVTLSSCGGSGSDEPNGNTVTATRSFYMGFTTWPYGATQAKVQNTYDLIQQHGDMVTHHLLEGIPWQESLDNVALPTAVEDDITFRVAQTQTDKVIYLAIDSLNSARADLAPNWGVTGNEPLSTQWAARDFDDVEVSDAYINFALRMIDRFNPDYFNYATEVSELILNDATRFAKFQIFASRVYQGIKSVYPNLPLLVSVALKSPGSTQAKTIETNFSSIIDDVDIVGVSVYPYAFFAHADKGDPANLPTDWLSQIKIISSDKPIAITETGWIAEDLEIAAYSFSEQSNSVKQQMYVKKLLSEAESMPVEFISWFTIVDFDDLWSGALAKDDLAKIWKDTGLYDGLLNSRPSLTSWDEYHAKDKN